MYNLTKVLLFSLTLAGSSALATEAITLKEQDLTIQKTAKKTCECTLKGCQCPNSGNGEPTGFVFKIRGSNNFSFAYANNKKFFELGKGVPKINVLSDISGEDNLEDEYPLSEARIATVKPLSDGGIIGDYTRKDKILNSNSLTIEAKRQVKDFAYGGFLEGEFGKENNIRAENAYIFFETNYGRFEMGRVKDSLVKTIRIDASTIARVGDDSSHNLDWHKLANLEGRPVHATVDPYGTRSRYTRSKHAQRPFLLHPEYYTPYSNPLRVNFITTGLGKLKLAGSYTDSAGARYRYIFDLGGNYSGIIKKLKFAFSLSGQMAAITADNALVHPLRRVEVGAMAEMRGIKVAGSWGNTFLSGIEKRKNMQLDLTTIIQDESQMMDTDGNGFYFTVGASFEKGPMMFSANYFESHNTFVKEVGVNTLRVIGLGTHYRITGEVHELTPYITAKYFMTEEAKVKEGDNNSGYVISSGVKVSY